MAPAAPSRRRSPPDWPWASTSRLPSPRLATISRVPCRLPRGWGTATDRWIIFHRHRWHVLTPAGALESLEGVHPPLGSVLEEMLKTGRSEGVPIVNPAA